MKTILLFVAAGILTEDQEAARSALRKHFPEARICPRNGSSVGLSKDSVEICDAVAGDPIPQPYLDRYPVVDLATMELSADPREVAAQRRQAALSSVARGHTPQHDLDPQVTGLPEGHPQDREGLKEALKGAGVPFHGSLGTPKLAELYRAEVLKETPPQQATTPNE